MQIVTMYLAEDGEKFYTESECLRHETALTNQGKANEMLREGRNLYNVMVQLNKDNNWWSVSEEEEKVLKSVTKDTKLIIQHWQCHEKPSYSPTEVSLGGRIYFGGVGGWSGYYGNWIESSDLVSYFERTFSTKGRL